MTLLSRHNPFLRTRTGADRFPRPSGAALCAAAGLLALALAAASDAPAVCATTTATGTLTTVNTFPEIQQGDNTTVPFYGVDLTLGSNGNIYGTRSLGGTGTGYGTIFTPTISAQSSPSTPPTPVYSFTDSAGDGEFPYGALVEDPSDGNFYGVTGNTVFKVTPSGTLTTIYSFTHGTDGYLPPGGLVLGTDGNFYGVNALGGANGTGTVFEVTPGGTFTLLYTFAADPSGSDASHRAGNSNGAYPNSPLTLGSDGYLYGTTSNGGAADYGTVFKIVPGSSIVTLHAFAGTADGAQLDESSANPTGALAESAGGLFYGITGTGGGTNMTGTVYSITSGGTFHTVHTFGPTTTSSNLSNQNGAFPVAGLVFGSDGALYGSTEFGGAYATGTLFRLTTGGDLSLLHTFAALSYPGTGDSTNPDGAYPTSSLVPDGTGLFYGATGYGGTNGSADSGVGTVFKLQVATTTTGPVTESDRFDFNQDTHSDLIWYNSGSGDVSVWDTNDQTVLQYGASFASVAPSSGWQPVAAPDVNNDNYPDLLWWNSQTGEMSFWTMQNTTVTSFGADFATIQDTTWKPVAAADVTGTTWELVFQNTASGDISVWQMNGQTVASYGPTIASLGTNSPYQIVGAPDLDGDGNSDLLFYDTQTGGVSYWSCNLANQQVLAYHGDFTSLTDLNWQLVGSEDTNGDGSPDLLWWNSHTGEVSRWLLSGTTVTQFGGDTAQVQDTTWKPTAIR